MIALLLCALLQEAPAIDGAPYEALETREATLQRMLDLLIPEDARWGEWWLASPFPYAGVASGIGAGGIDEVHPPELELERMTAGGPGPDLAATYAGKGGVEVRWQPLGYATNHRVELKVHGASELDLWATCYLYCPVDADEAVDSTVTLGTDDGVRVWLNGEVVHDLDVPRGMTPDDDTVTFPFEAGRNHVLIEVTQGVGNWEFQINTREALTERQDALLYYRLDRDFPPSREREHWRVMTFPAPEEVVLEVGGLAFLGDGRPLACTRRGDVWIVEDAYDEPPLAARYVPFASGLHEPLGLAVRSEEGRDAVYCVQRSELTRLVDEDGDDRADRYETFCDAWGVSGNYHEFAFGPKIDAAGDLWVTLNVGFCGSLGKSTVPWRGWAVRVTPSGELIPVCDGLRSPNGIGFFDGEPFYVDNQGDYVATNRLAHLAPGSWHGHPASLRWRDDLATPDERPPRQPAAVWFPYKKMGQSAADLVSDDTGGAFGPFTGQLFVGDQTHATVMRVFLEEVEGLYQGACFPFLSGFGSGVNRLAFAPDGSLFVGQTDRGWASVGRKRYGLERVVYTGVEPFEILAMRALPDGFELELTRDVDPASAADPGSYAMTSYTYAYHAEYGAPEEDALELAVTSATVLDPRRVQILVEPLRQGYVHELAALGLRSAEGEELLHADAYYTLQNVPGRDPIVLDTEPALRRVLFLSHSAGYEHDVVKRPTGQYSVAELALLEAAAGRFDVTATQDADALNPADLVHYDAVVLYTTGELPIPDEHRSAFLDWIRRGGALVGVHCATDTWYDFPEFQEVLGGAFDGHPWNQEVGVRVEDPTHPATDHLGASFRITDEIYRFRDFRRHPVNVLLSLDTSTVDASLGGRTDRDYALAWWRDWGQGRVFYTALGHGPDVWADPRFREHLLDGIGWAVDGPEHSPPPPEGAVALFDGTDLAAWRQRGDGAPTWQLVEGAMEVAGDGGDLFTREDFGDALVHVELRTPRSSPDAVGQARGNSGVYLHGRYEVQVLDSYGLEPGLGDCAAIYGVKPPDVNASRPPLVWQSYDIRFTAPRFDPDGTKIEDARLSVWHNGIPVHRDVPVPAPTGGGLGGEETERGPLLFQDHGNPVQYRNVWVLPLDR